MVLQKDTIMPFKIVINTKNNVSIVKCLNSDDVPKACDILKEKLGENFEVETQQLNQPKIKIFGIPKDFELKDIEDDIHERNVCQYNNNKCSVLHAFNCANNTKVQ